MGSSNQDRTRRLHLVANAPGARFVFRDHAITQMALPERKIARIDVQKALKTGFVSGIDMSKGEETWNVDGKDLDDRRICVVVVVYDELIRIKIITAFPI
jgi:Domain of unknown function (DUF4258)